MGLIAMSERDLQRIEILSKVIAGRMTLVSAARVLGLSERRRGGSWSGSGRMVRHRSGTRRSPPNRFADPSLRQR